MLVRVVAFLNSASGVWLMPAGYRRQDDYVDGTIDPTDAQLLAYPPELGTVIEVAPVPADEDSYFYARSRRGAYLIVGVPVVPS